VEVVEEEHKWGRNRRALQCADYRVKEAEAIVSIECGWRCWFAEDTVDVGRHLSQDWCGWAEEIAKLRGGVLRAEGAEDLYPRPEGGSTLGLGAAPDEKLRSSSVGPVRELFGKAGLSYTRLARNENQLCSAG
jgi:hypothetical protein